MSELDIEIGEEAAPSRCHCCGHLSYNAHGFVYRNGDAYAIYYASWSDTHSDKYVTFAIAIGMWDDGSDAGDRTCFGLEACKGDHDVRFRIIEPHESPWGQTELLGSMVNRETALNHPLKLDLFAVVDEVVAKHPAIRRFLGIT